MINFRVKNLQEQSLTALTLIVCINFCKINFRSRHGLQKYFTTKISRFTVDGAFIEELQYSIM